MLRICQEIRNIIRKNQQLSLIKCNSKYSRKLPANNDKMNQTSHYPNLIKINKEKQQPSMMKFNKICRKQAVKSNKIKII